MRYQGIKVTLVTGFLGSGKTTLIRQILSHAPKNERWVVLVNEFGDIGLDGVFYSDLGVAIKEVPGGCVCCTTSAAFQKGLNELIREHNPDRIIIEPSGLGHPKQIVEQLRGQNYQDVLLLSGVFCVLDARNLSDERYTQHGIFNDQISVANGIVFSHVDQYLPSDLERIDTYFEAESSSNDSATLFLADPMYIDFDNLDIGLRNVETYRSSHPDHEHHHDEHHHDHHHHRDDSSVSDKARSDIEYYEKHQDAMTVIGWKWTETRFFDADDAKQKFTGMMNEASIYRIKAVLLLAQGDALFINASRGDIDFKRAPFNGQSRLEVIGKHSESWINIVTSNLPNQVI